jgi:hypothetical protein
LETDLKKRKKKEEMKSKKERPFTAKNNQNKPEVG